MDRILVVRGGALGDFILGLPALQRLRNRFPRSHLEVMAPSAVLPLASQLANRLAPLDGGEISALFGDPRFLPDEIAARYRGLDLAVLWLSDAEGSMRRSFEMLGARRILWSPALPPAGRHATDHLLSTLEPLGIPCPASGGAQAGASGVVGTFVLSSPESYPPAPVVRPSHAALERASHLWCDLGLGDGRLAVVVHPGSGGDWKRWPVERFALVIDHLTEAGVGAVLVQGPADADVVPRVVGCIRGKRPPVVSGLGVEELAALLSLASCYLGNDSGVTHLSAAVGTPTVAIFGPTDPAQWAPRGGHVVVLRSEQECAPCGGTRGAVCPRRLCLESIGVERVTEVVLRQTGLAVQRSVSPPSSGREARLFNCHNRPQRSSSP